MNNGFFVFECPFCGQKLECDESWENQKTQCPTCGKEIVPTKNAEIPASDKSKLAMEKRNVILGVSGGFLAGFLISFAVFYLIFGVAKKEKSVERKQKVEIVKKQKTFPVKNNAESGVAKMTVPVQNKVPEVVNPMLSQPVQKKIAPETELKDMLQIKILTSDWSNPTPDMLKGMRENNILKAAIKPLVENMQKHYPATWNMAYLQKAGTCQIEGEPGQVYISGNIDSQNTKISLIFQKNDSDDKYDFGLYATENGKVYVEFAIDFYCLALKCDDLSKRFKSGSRKKKSEKSEISRGEIRGHDYFEEIRFSYDPNGPVYQFSGKIYTRESSWINVKISGKEFSKMSLALLYAFHKLENHHLKRYYWYKTSSPETMKSNSTSVPVRRRNRRRAAK